MRKAFIVILICLIVLSTTATSQTRRRTAKTPAKSTAEVKAGRDALAAQIKILTRFLYLLGGISKGIESNDLAVRSGEASPDVSTQNEQNKTKLRASLTNVREGLDKLEADFRLNPALRNYYRYLSGVARIGETAENQAAANRFDEAGRSLLAVVGQLADALAAMP